MKVIVGIVVLMSLFVGLSSVCAQVITLEGIDDGTTTTGDCLDDISDLGITTNVVEIPFLKMSARSGETNQTINVTANSLGINTEKIPDETDAFESGERIILSFNKDIQISRIDLNRLSSNETFTINIPSVTNIVIQYSSLNNKQRGYFDATISVPANTEIECFTTGASVVGLDGMTVEVIEPKLSINNTNGSAQISAQFNTAALSNFILQHRISLEESTTWSSFSLPFAEDSSWTIPFSNTAGFYRVVVD